MTLRTEWQATVNYAARLLQELVLSEGKSLVYLDNAFDFAESAVARLLRGDMDAIYDVRDYCHQVYGVNVRYEDIVGVIDQIKNKIDTED